MLTKELLTMSPVIDFHLHVVTYQELRPWVVEYRRSMLQADTADSVCKCETPGELEAMLKDSGVDCGVILAETSPVTTGMASSEQIADFCRGSDKLIPFATVNPFLVANPASQVEHYVRDLGCKGVKLYPTYQGFYPNDSLIYPVYAKAAALNVPVVFHTGSSVFKGSRLKFGDPLLLDDVAVDFPELNIVMAHSGRGFWYDRAFFLARLHQNVYMEISGLPPQNLLSYFPEFERNADKIIFGSDWPGMPYIKRNIDGIRGLQIKEETKEKILGGNAARLLGIEVADRRSH